MPREDTQCITVDYSRLALNITAPVADGALKNPMCEVQTSSVKLVGLMNNRPVWVLLVRFVCLI